VKAFLDKLNSTFAAGMTGSIVPEAEISCVRVLDDDSQCSHMYLGILWEQLRSRRYRPTTATPMASLAVG
jgi:hypothetical protein